VLHTLIGYSDQPSWLQVAIYATTLAGIFALTAAFSPRARRAAVAAE
jgi:high-affinity iron transporter